MADGGDRAFWDEDLSPEEDRGSEVAEGIEQLSPRSRDMADGDEREFRDEDLLPKEDGGVAARLQGGITGGKLPTLGDAGGAILRLAMGVGSLGGSSGISVTGDCRPAASTVLPASGAACSLS
jgi:hypothetical protein